MHKIAKNQKGFTGVEGLLIILVLVVIGVAGYMVYHNNHKTTTPTVSTTAATKTTKPTIIAEDWGTATLPNEKLTFSYPDNWKFANLNAQANINNGSDEVGLTSPNGTEVIIMTSNQEHPGFDGPITLVYADPTTFLGKTAYIDYYANGTSVSSPISGGEVAYSSTDYPEGSGNPLSSPDFLKTKNMNPQGWLLIDVNTAAKSSVYKSDIISNQDFIDIKLIVQSMHY